MHQIVKKPETENNSLFASCIKFFLSITFGFLIFLSFFFLLSEKLNLATPKRIKNTIIFYSAPFLNFVKGNLSLPEVITKDLQEIWFLHEENEKLRLENQKLRKIQKVYFVVKEENEKLRKFANIEEEIPYYDLNFENRYDLIRARIVGQFSAANNKTAYIYTKGEVQEGAIVLSKDNKKEILVGTIYKVHGNVAHVRLISEEKSRVPIKATESGEKAIMVGNRSDQTELKFFYKSSKIKVGEKIVTSGDGEFFPDEILVGYVSATDKGKIMINPAINWNYLDYVMILNPRDLPDDE